MFEINRGTSNDDGECFIDGYQLRNLAPFINFSCAPNLHVEPRLSAAGDRRMPRVAFFAKDRIDIGKELTYRRDISAWSRSSWSNIACHCKSEKCRGKL